MRDGKVIVGYCSPGEVRTEWHESLLNLLVYDSYGARRVLDGGGRLGVTSSANIAQARNAIVKGFLEGEAEWLWMVDTDMVFPPETLELLLAQADPVKAPIVGGLCYGHEPARGGRLFPTLYDIGGTPDAPQVLRYESYPPNAMFQVFATGAACLLVHRSALEAVRDYRSDGKSFSDVFPWFQETCFRAQDGRDVMQMSEDVTFCWRAAVCGLPVYVNTGVPVGHVKTRVLTEDLFLAQCDAEAAAGGVPEASNG